MVHTIFRLPLLVVAFLSWSGVEATGQQSVLTESAPLQMTGPGAGKLSLFAQATSSAAASVPTITSISWATGGGTQVITILGSGFGTQNPYQGDGNHLRIYNQTRHLDAGWLHCWNGCRDWVGLNVTSWSDTAIVISGFAMSFGGQLFSAPGDTVTVYVSNASDQSPPTGTGNAAVMSNAAAYTLKIGSTSNATVTLELLMTLGRGYGWFALSSDEAQTLMASVKQDLGSYATAQSQFAIAVFPGTPASAQVISEFGQFFALWNAAQSTLGNLAEAGDTGVEILTIAEAATLAQGDPFSALANIDNGQLKAFYQSLDHAYTTFARTNSNICSESLRPICPCTGWTPDYIVGPSQALIVVATNLSGLPTGTMTLSFGFRNVQSALNGLPGGPDAPAISARSGNASNLVVGVSPVVDYAGSCQ